MEEVGVRALPKSKFLRGALLMVRRYGRHNVTMQSAALAFFLLFTFASMITYNTWVLLGLMVVSFVSFKLSRIKIKEVSFMLVFMLVFLLLNMGVEK